VGVTPVNPAANGRMAGIERDVPALVPVEEIRILLKAVRKLVEAEAVEDSRVFQVRLSDECFGRANIILFLPVNRNLGLRHFRSSISRHERCLPLQEWPPTDRVATKLT